MVIDEQLPESRLCCRIHCWWPQPVNNPHFDLAHAHSHLRTPGGYWGDPIHNEINLLRWLHSHLRDYGEDHLPMISAWREGTPTAFLLGNRMTVDHLLRREVPSVGGGPGE